MITTISEMLSLPKQERAPYLRAMPLTRCKSFWAMDDCHLRYIRRLLKQHGAVYREHYCMWGYSVAATFRTQAGMRGFAAAVCDWYNKGVRAGNSAGWSEEELADLLWDPAHFWNQGVVAPALEYGVENYIYDEPRVYATNHKLERMQ
jgi:hypothetical protein